MIRLLFGTGLSLAAMAAGPALAAADGLEAERARLWAFDPPVRPALPDVRNQEWARTPLDRFILARLEGAGLEPSPRAGKAALLRRATLDLTGLPPSPSELR